MQLAMHMVTIEDLMPQGHFLRKLEAALDLSFVYEETAPLYSKKYGRPAIDPVVIVKYLLVGFLYGIPSERQIERRVQTDIALRWYLGLDLFDRVPDHSTVSQLRRRKPSFRKVFRRLFEEVVGQCIEKGLVSGRVVGADSTHVRANASRASEELVEVAEEAGVYWERLDDYEEEGLEELERRTGKRRKKRTKQIKRDNRRTHKRVSRTDPESGHLKRPGKPEGPHYLAHQAVDSDYGIIVGQTVTAGDVNDSVPFLGLIEHIHENVVPIQAAAADAAYDFPLAHRALGELGIGFFVRPQKTAARVSVQFTRDDFCRDENRDVYLCPIGKELCLRRLARSASGLFWEYQADKRDCALCPLREKVFVRFSTRRIGSISRPPQLWYSRQQFAGIVCLRILQDIRRFAVFDSLSVLHDQYPICHRADNADIVRNKHNRRTIGLAQQRQFFQHLFLYRNIQCGCRFISK